MISAPLKCWSTPSTAIGSGDDTRVTDIRMPSVDCHGVCYVRQTVANANGTGAIWLSESRGFTTAFHGHYYFYMVVWHEMKLASHSIGTLHETITSFGFSPRFAFDCPNLKPVSAKPISDSKPSLEMVSLESIWRPRWVSWLSMFIICGKIDHHTMS